MVVDFHAVPKVIYPNVKSWFKSCFFSYNFQAYTLPFTLNCMCVTVACIIVRRLLISVHKWQSSGMADTHEYWSQHDAHLVYLPIFHGLNLIIFS